MLYVRRCCVVLLALCCLGLLTAQTPLARQEVRITRGAAAQVLARFTVEIADTPETWARGLMERVSLAPEAGMLFVFPEVAPRGFWMMNTWIPLDMLFIGADRRIINIQANAMPCIPPRPCRTYPSAAPAQYVLEIAGGRAAALGIQAGDEVHFSP
ncbi:MAG: DUF192 domain-containing protein [Candidatus Tectimicrobiota bacterium]